MIEIPDFVPHAPVEVATIDAYRERVPAELVELWEHYGYGTFGEGFVRVIDPELYGSVIGDSMGKVVGDPTSIPIMVTALADVITWEPDRGVGALLFRKGEVTGLGSRLRTFLKLTNAGGAKHLERVFDWDPYPAAVDRHGVPAYDQAFVHVPLLSLGGSRTVDSLQPRQTLSAIEVMLEMQGPLEH